MTHNAHRLAAHRLHGEPERTLTGALACYRIYATADGRYLTITPVEPKFWRRLCELIGREDLVDRQYEPTRRRSRPSSPRSSARARSPSGSSCSRARTSWPGPVGDARRGACLVRGITAGTREDDFPGMSLRQALSLLCLAAVRGRVAGCGGDTLSFDPVASARRQTAVRVGARRVHGDDGRRRRRRDGASAARACSTAARAPAR
jgi:hypothetical protein